MSIPVFDPSLFLDTCFYQVRPILSWLVGIPLVILTFVLILGLLGGFLFIVSWIAFRVCQTLWLIFRPTPSVSICELKENQKVKLRDGSVRTVTCVHPRSTGVLVVRFDDPCREFLEYNRGGDCITDFTKAIVAIIS